MVVLIPTQPTFGFVEAVKSVFILCLYVKLNFEFMLIISHIQKGGRLVVPFPIAHTFIYSYLNIVPYIIFYWL